MMGSQTLLQLTATAACSSSPPSCPLPLAWHSSCAVGQVAASNKCWNGSCVAKNPHFNLINLSVSGSRTLRLSPANGQRTRRQLRVEASFGKKKPAAVGRETVIPDPDYRTSIVLLGAAGAFIYSDNLFAAAPVGILGLFLLLQTTRVKFVFDNDSLEVKLGEDLEDSGENVFVGGENRWKYSTFINWEFWWPNFPVLVYFKETQTKPEGQIHFFPVLFNGKQVYDTMVERCGPSKTSGPK